MSPYAAVFATMPESDQRDRDRRREIGAREPGVEREQRQLDDERRAEQEREAGLRRRAEPDLVERGDVERPHRDAEGEGTGQEQRASGHRVEKESEGRGAPVLPTPLPEEQREGQEHRLPEHEEEEQVLRDEDPGDRGLERAPQGEIAAAARAACGRADGEEEATERQKRQPEPVGPDVIAGPQRRRPDELLLAAEHTAGRRGPHGHGDRDPRTDDARGARHPPRKCAERQQRAGDRGDERDDDEVARSAKGDHRRLQNASRMTAPVSKSAS